MLTPETPTAPPFPDCREITTPLSDKLDPWERVRVYALPGTGMVRVTVRNAEQELSPDERRDLVARLAEAGMEADA